MGVIVPFANPHGLRAPATSLPYDAATVLARYAAKCRRRLGMHPIADEIVTAPAPWHADILAAQAAGARMAGVYSSEPMPLAQAAPRLPRRGWPWGEHSRPGPLTEAELDAHIAETRAASVWASCSHRMPAIFGAGLAMYYQPAPTWRERMRRAWTDFRIRRMGRL